MSRKPIISVKQFVTAHEDLDKEIWRYHVSAAGKNKLPPEIMAKLLKQNAIDMFAMNPHTRIVFAERADRYIRQRLTLGEITDAFFVDIACKKHIRSISDVENFDLEKIRKWMSARLENMNFFGALDAAYYYDGTPLTNKKEPAVCWHGHFMVWGTTQKHLKKRQKKTNERFEAGWPGGKCFYFKNWTENIEGRAMYMMKAPQSEYSVALYKQHKETFDPETGEVEEIEIDKAKQYKRPLRAGSFKNIVDLYSRVEMRDILIAGGQGKSLLSDVINSAANQLAEDREAQRAARAEAIGLPWTPNAAPLAWHQLRQQEERANTVAVLRAAGDVVTNAISRLRNAPLSPLENLRLGVKIKS
ncbi:MULTISPECIES: hypothetical protein [Agrobacterium]|uniref:hypothetical protein n=1 Tax=Agrobacterium TaxID=357 RepID=UPI002300EEA9|nr:MULTISPECIES: hypothetical protein [Agrobacterium]MDA5637891.1 hypothetical protein [Agrobacterium sp. ST15.13.013]MDA6997436.1 hypothetical protein [Agrobacterium salinitolerans]